MRAREVRLYCRSLLVAGTLAGSASPVLAQSADLAHDRADFAAPVFRQVVPSLPRFLDQQRLSDLHHAWHMRAGAPEQMDDAQASQSDAAGAGDVTAMSAARAAMERRKTAARQAPDVRLRAEALSRMFGSSEPATEAADANGAAPAINDPAAAATITTASTTPASAAKAKAQEPPVDAPDATAAASTETPSATTAAVEDEPPLDPPYAVGGPLPDADEVGAQPKPLPPLPQRAPEAAQETSPVVTTTRSTPSRPARRSKPDPATVFPDQLRAFGWNTQPE